MVRGALGTLVGLADPTRSRIVSLIRENPEGRARVGDLAEAIGLTQPTVSHHMKALLADGIVVRDPRGRNVWYSIRPDRLAQIDDLLGLGGGDRGDARERIIDDLAARFAGRLNRETVASYVDDSFELLRASSRDVRPSRAARFAA